MTVQKRPCFRHSRIPVFLTVLLACLLCILAEALVWPTASGDKVLKKNGTVIDASNAADGYIMVKQSAGNKRYKLRVEKGGETYTYDLNNEGEYEVFPLQLGVGTYKVSVYKQKSGSKYASVSSQSVSVDAFNQENACFLCPNQYVNYGEDSTAVAKAAELCEGLTDDGSREEAIRSFILRAVQYDYILALTVEKGYLPDPDAVLKKGQGICFDYASLFATMLRSQGIPAQLVIGYADGAYHSWNSVYLNGSWQRIDLTSQSTGMKVLEYTTERYY